MQYAIANNAAILYTISMRYDNDKDLKVHENGGYFKKN